MEASWRLGPPDYARPGDLIALFKLGPPPAAPRQLAWAYTAAAAAAAAGPLVRAAARGRPRRRQQRARIRARPDPATGAIAAL